MRAYAVLFTLAQGQQTAVPVEGPSYREDAASNRRHPDSDTDVSFYINHWRNSPLREGHGGLIERDILTRGDPFHPREKGAVLRFLAAYRRALDANPASLEPRWRIMRIAHSWACVVPAVVMAKSTPSPSVSRITVSTGSSSSVATTWNGCGASGYSLRRAVTGSTRMARRAGA